MVSYYNTLSYSQKHSAANLPYPAGQPWAWQSNYHPPPNHQFLGDVESPHSVGHHPSIQYYNHMFGNHPSADWHTTTENFQNATQSHLLQQHHQNHQNQQHQQQLHHQHQQSGATQLNDTASSVGEAQIADGLPSPPITVSGSELSSPGAPASSSSPHGNMSTNSSNNNNPNNNNNSTANTSAGSSGSNGNTTINNNTIRSSPVKSPYYDWMKKQSYTAQPTPGKTRTKDKYRVVYTDFQRLELEKEYCTSRYITIRRKTELAQSLQLSERQVKIWFQNRRAKERKQNKKRDDPMSSVVQHPDLASYMDTKPKIEPGLHHLQHSLHPMTSMAMNMPMSLHHHHSVLHHGHHPLAVPPGPQHLHQTHSAALPM